MSKQTRNYRKFVATAATATLVASAIVPVASADESPAHNFTDVAGNYDKPVSYLYSKDILKGISDTQFGTQQNIKRVDVGIMLAKALLTEEEIEAAPASGFTDVPARAAKYINALKENKIVNGKTATSFGAQDPITRGEAALMLAKAYEITGDVANVEFSDVANRYKESVAALVDNDITKGKGDNKFGTTDAIKRGELAIFLYKLETLNADEDEDQEEVTALEVETVNNITEDEVSLTIKAAAETDEEATVEVKDADGNIVPVKTAVIEKGDTEVTFEFAEKVDAEDLDGVWTVNGVEYSFTAIEQLAAIKEAAGATQLNELTLVEALEDANVKNVDANKAAAYAKALKDADAEVESLADVQEIIDTVNKQAVTEAEKAEAVKAVKEASSQTELLTALQNFERVNKDWIVGYAADLLVDNLNKDFEGIQTAIDEVNETEIEKSVKKAEAALDSKLVKTATELVNKYKVNDEEDAEDTPKADLLAKLEVHQAVITVNAANTNDKLKAAVDALAELTEDIDVETVHVSLLQNYRDAIKAETTVANKNTATALQTIIETVNDEVKSETLEAINKVNDDTTEADVLKLLQNEALGLEGVVSDYAADYKTAVVDAEADLTDETVQQLVKDVNAAQEEDAKLATVNNSETDADMRNALTAISADKKKNDFLNLSSQAKLEVSNLVLQAKADEEEGFADLDAVLAEITDAINTRTSFVSAVNGSETIVAMTEALSNKTVFPEFEALSSVKKNEVAEIVLNALEEREAGFETIAQIKAAANL